MVWDTSHWDVSQWDASYVESVEWVTSVGSVITSVFLMFSALHIAVQHGICALSIRTTVESCVSVCKVCYVLCVDTLMYT